MKISGNKTKIASKENAEITQQKRRPLPLQLQEAVEKETNKLLADGHNHRVEIINDKARADNCQTRQSSQISARCQIAK